jgi:hypothetical protein
MVTTCGFVIGNLSHFSKKAGGRRYACSVDSARRLFDKAGCSLVQALLQGHLSLFIQIRHMAFSHLGNNFTRDTAHAVEWLMVLALALPLDNWIAIGRPFGNIPQPEPGKQDGQRPGRSSYAKQPIGP